MKQLTIDERTQLLELFHVPSHLVAEALQMITLQEKHLILVMGRERYTTEQLCALIQEHALAQTPQTLIDDAYGRAVLYKVRDEENILHYAITNLYERYPYFAQYDYDAYRFFTDAQKKKLNDWDLEVYTEQLRSDVERNMQGDYEGTKQSVFVTLDEAEARLRKATAVYRTNCNCKMMMDVTTKDRNCCLNLGIKENSPTDRRRTEKISVEHAIELIHQWNKQGLMQNDEGYGICNCDGQSCYPMQVAKKLGSRGMYPKVNYDIVWDESSCIHCGKCANICNFEAFQKGADGKITFDKEKCWSCTICAANCPKKCIQLQPRG